MPSFLKHSFVLIAFGFSTFTYAAVIPEIDQLFNELSNDNKEIETADLQTQLSYQSLRGSKSKLFPALTFSSTLNQSEDGAIQSTSANLDASGETSSATSALDDASNGWALQMSMDYFVFAHYQIEEGIKSSDRDYVKSQLSESETFDSKKAQLLQLILEWQVLRSVRPAILDASEMMKNIVKYSKGRSRMLYTSKDRAELDEKATSIEYNKVKIIEGMNLIEEAVRSLLPNMTRDRLNQLPEIEVSYPIPANSEVRELYFDRSRSHRKAQMDIESAVGTEKVYDWKRPWIPTVYWSASYSYNGNWSGEENDGGASTSLLFSFNLFDGFYTQARAQQARIGVELSKNRQILEADKRILVLKRNRMKAEVAKAESKYKQAIARKKYLRYKDVQRKIRQGVGSKLDLSASSLDYVNAQMEALSSLKDYQQAMLDIAVELDDFGRVDIERPQ